MGIAVRRRSNARGPTINEASPPCATPKHTNATGTFTERGLVRSTLRVDDGIGCAGLEATSAPVLSRRAGESAAGPF
jgi:hypothetical protein